MHHQRYKELGGPYYNTDASLIKPTSPVEVGTKWDAGGMWMDSTGYASAKVAGEALAESLTQSGTSTTQFITGIVHKGGKKEGGEQKTIPLVFRLRGLFTTVAT